MRASAASASTAAATGAPINRPAATTSNSFADDVAQLVGELDLTDLTLIAHSMAGGEAVQYLTRHGSKRVARLVLLAPTTPMLLKTADNPNGLADGSLRGAMGSVAARLSEMGRRQCRAVLHSGNIVRNDALGRHAAHDPASITLACSRAMVEEDFRAEMRRIDVPSLIVHGDRDRSMPVELTGKPRPSSSRAQGSLSIRARRTASHSPIWISSTPTSRASCASTNAAPPRPDPRMSMNKLS